MRAQARARAWCLGLALVGLAVTAAPAAADLDWHECSDAAGYACAHLLVPLDRSGQVPGTVSLAVRRRRAPVGPAPVAVFALAGGPGQGATALTGGLAGALGPVLGTRDLIVFDQRGTGSSGPLKCAALAAPNIGQTPPPTLVADCAHQVGPGRGDYTTATSVADLEALRAATGYERIDLYGTSYGTKVALDYARAYPQHVDRLLLDSVVAPDGPDVFSRSTFHAVPRVLGQLCGAGRCDHITAAPSGDVAALAARLRRHSLTAPVVDGRGRRHAALVSDHDLLDILVDGDLDPTLRVDFPAAVRSALDGDGAPLARLSTRATASQSVEAGVDVPLFFSTYCEEIPFPWSRAAAPGVRLSQFETALDAIPQGAFAPFDRGVALFESGALQCFAWPFASAAPQPPGPPLPAVPTLILSGADDLRTPTEDARTVAAQIPGSQMLVVPQTGHSVLGTDPSNCSQLGVRAFFAGAAVKPCGAPKPAAVPRPSPVAPLRLSQVPRFSGIAGRAGRTATAVVLTLADLGRQLVDRFQALSPSAGLASLLDLGIGGLRGGYARLRPSGLTLHQVVFVPGVTVSGRLSASGIVLRVGGRAAAAGVLRGRAGGSLRGTLGGRRVRLRPPRRVGSVGAMASAARVGPIRGPRVP